MTLPPTRQFSCIERVNVPNLNRSICHLASTPKLQNDENKYNAFQELRKIKKRAGKEGQYKVNFLLKDFGSMETKALGRMYAKGSSLQYLNREYRKALVYDKYTDIDIENAHPSLISQIFKEQGLKCKTLDDYVANRGKFLEIVDKTQWLALLNNKVPKDNMSSLEKEYWNDVISCATDLFQKPVFETYLAKGKKKNPGNPLGWAISQLATDLERFTVNVAMESLDYAGYTLGTLIHDGFLIESLNVKDKDLRDAEARVKKETGFRIQLVRKPLNDFNREEILGPEPETPETEDDAVSGGDQENAQLFLKWLTTEGHEIVRKGKDIYWYRPEHGVYTQDLTTLRVLMHECPLLDDPYRSMTKRQDNLKVQFLALIPEDDDLYERMFQSTYRKLAFQNGVYDFEKKELVDFSSEYFFTFKAPVELKLEGNEDLEKQVYQKLFIDVFGDPEVNGDGTLNYSEKKDEKALYYKKILARAIAGEIYDKNFFIVIGEGNSGKGTNTDGLVGAFGNFTDNVNAGSFSKKVGEDQAKARSWIVKLKNTRIAYANEVSMDASLDASVIKTISSGGDPITARQNYGEECTFRLQTTAIFFVIEQKDD